MEAELSDNERLGPRGRLNSEQDRGTKPGTDHVTEGDWKKTTTDVS